MALIRRITQLRHSFARLRTNHDVIWLLLEKPSFGEDVLDVVLRGPVRQEQDRGDLAVGLARGDQFGDLEFPRRERRYVTQMTII